jgi:hypothetical protein
MLSTIVVFLDIIHRLSFDLKNLLETGVCLRLQMEHTQLGPLDRNRSMATVVLMYHRHRVLKPSSCFMSYSSVLMMEAVHS